MSKRMIFHIPMQLDLKMHSGSQIRPVKIIQAFKNIGYQIDVVMGYGKDRKKQITRIKNNIKSGVKYDFLYSESSTMPTLLTEKSHLPLFPFLDFSFFRFCKKHRIKIGLFYRDVYWVLDEAKTFKQKVAKWFYRYDLNQYNKLLDILYLPSKKMYDYVPFEFSKKIVALPPAIEKTKNIDRNTIDNLNFIYIGGISELYDLKLFCKVLSEQWKGKLIICTREKEWEEYKASYLDYLKYIQVEHKSGTALEALYLQASIAVYFVKPNDLWSFAMGVKLFEYLSFKKPIIAVRDTAVGQFVEENNIGWVIDYDEEKLKTLLLSLKNHPEYIEEKINNIEKIIPKHTWEARAKKVVSDLA